MKRIVIRLALALACLAPFAPLAPGADGDKDRISGTKAIEGYVIREGSDEVLYKLHPSQPQPQKLKAKDVKRIEYAGMRSDGLWAKGQEAKARGNYGEAADRFEQLAAGAKEWEKVYGSLALGEALEMDQKFDAAAEAFGKVVGGAPFDKDDKAAPRHRLWLDAAYRHGVALARAGKGPESSKIADGLTAYGKLPGSINGSGAEARGNAVRAAAAASTKDWTKLREYSQKAILRSAEEPDVWFHFNIYVAQACLDAGQFKDAKRIIDTMIDDPALVANPARKSELEMMRGICLVETDPQAAVVELIKIDVLPYGSEDQKCQARFLAGKLLSAEAVKMKAEAKDDRRLDIARDTMRAARMMLSAAADSTSSISAKAQARTLLDELGPEDAKPAEAKDAEAKDAEAPAKDAAAPAKDAAPAK